MTVPSLPVRDRTDPTELYRQTRRPSSPVVLSYRRTLDPSSSRHRRRHPCGLGPRDPGSDFVVRVLGL